MAQIKYLDSRRIMGASGDTVEAQSLDYNFPNTTNWTSADSFTDGTISSNKLNYTGDSNTNSSLSFDMEDATTGIGETISDTAWVLRFGLQIVSWVNASTDKVRLGIGLSSADSSTGYSSAQDSISINLQADNDGSERVYTDWSNGASMENGQVRTSSDFTATQYYVELIRTSSSTFTMQFYSDSAYTTTVSGIDASRTGVSNVTGLRYFVVKNYTDASTDGNIVLKISDLQFWNGISSLTNKPAPALSLSGCKAYYNFEQTSGSLTNIATTANGFDDGLGSSADGTNNGATTGATGKVGSYAWDFTGASDYVTIGDTSTWKFLHDETTSNTISFWVKRSGTQASSEPCILDTQGGTGSNVGLSLYFDTSNNLYYYMSDGTGSDTKSSSAITTSTTDFDHLVFVQDWTNLTIYKNGSSIQTIDMTSFSGSTGNSAYALNIGRNARSGANANFYLDELAIFSRALTSSEVSTLYNSGSGREITSSLATAPETNSIFIETDTASRWWFDGTNWNMQPTFEDDFKTDKGWTSSNTTYFDYDSANKRLKTAWYGTGNIQMTYDLGAGNVSDTMWILRMKINLNAAGGADNEGFIGVSSADYTVPRTTAQDFIGLCFLHDYSGRSQNGFYNASVDNAVIPPTNNNQLQYDTADNTDYWLELKRTSPTSFTYTLYSDSAFSNVLGTKTVTIASTISSLRYIKFANYNGAATNLPNAYVDDIKFYNGVSSVQQ